MFGNKISVQFASPGPLTRTPVGDGVAAKDDMRVSKKWQRTRPGDSERRECCGSASNDSGIKLSSSDENDCTAEERAAGALLRPCQSEPALSCVMSNADDVVVEEVVSVDGATSSGSNVNVRDSDVQKSPSKQTEKANSHCAATLRKLIVGSYSGQTSAVLKFL